MPDLNQPLPDRAHEGLRQALVAAVSDLAQNVIDLGDGFTLADVAFELIDAIFLQLDDHTARLDALENPTP